MNRAQSIYPKVIYYRTIAGKRTILITRNVKNTNVIMIYINK